MSKELVIGSSRHETKVAVLEDDQLVEVYFQRGKEYALAGSIHKGRVTRVLPGMQSAFVDLGLERDTFLYVSDFFEEHDDIDTVGDDAPARRDSERKGSIEGRDQRRANESRTGERISADRIASGNERLPEELFAEPAKIRTIDASPLDLVESFDDEPVSAGSPEAPGGQAASDRDSGDSSRVDRNNRRGRRRRPRGRGFPETKYAQPSAESVIPAPVIINRAPIVSHPPDAVLQDAPPAERPSFQRAYADRSTLDRISTERSPLERQPRRDAPSEESSPSEVIILPGESLAKYRKLQGEPSTASIAPAAAPLMAELKPVQFETSHELELVEPASDPLPKIDAPPVLATSPSVVPQAEEFASEPVLSAEGNFDEQLSIEDLAEEQKAIKEEAVELELADRIFSHHEPEEILEEEKLADIEIERIDPLDSHQAQGDFAHPSEHASVFDITSPAASDDRPLASFEGNAPLGLTEEGELDEAEVIGPDGLASESEGTAEYRGEPAQTATLRDQSGRSMHRVSRRSRRRRGGNRFGSPSETPLTAPSPATGTGAGVATAFQPESRPELSEVRTVSLERVERSAERPERTNERTLPSISDLLKAGQEIIVQIAKEPLGQKGARITSHIALPGRYVVFMPSVTHLGVSRKVASDEERQRLKQILQKHKAGTTGGFIVRTAGEGVLEEEIAADMNFLYNLWLDIRQKAEKKPAPALLHYDLDIVQRILRDQVTEDYKAIWVDNEEMYESVLTFMQRFQPSLVSRVKMYTRAAPIFDAFNITQELEKALRPKVWLKSGGYIVINQTEALVAIDINTGKYVGKSNRLEDTIVKTNTEAVKEIVRQIRLRDLGGIIVVDFIDMDERKNRQKVMAALEEAMESDKAPYKILQFNDFGLVAITRKRVKQSLERTLCSPCPYCEGAGYVKSVQTTIGEILVEAQKIARAIDGKDVVLRVHPEVAKVLKASNNHFLEEMEEILGRPVLVAGDGTLHTEKFDLA